MKRAPDELERIDDYVRGVGSEADAESFETDLFTRALAGEASDLAAFDWLVASIRRQAERGTMMNYITPQEAAEMRRRYGERIAFIEVASDNSRQRIVLPPAAEFLMTRCALDLRGIERVDIEAQVEGFGTVKVMPDITFDPESGALYGCCEMALARQTAGMPILSKYWGYGPEGRKLLAEIYATVELG